MPPDDPTFGALSSKMRNTYEHSLIKPIPHIEHGDIFDDSNDEIIRNEHDKVDKD